MAQQEEGWPLGLQPLNMRGGMVRNHDFSGSISFNTFLTGSPSASTDSSSDLDTESTGSFFHDKSITLGSLIGVSNILELSRRSTKGRRAESLRGKKSCKSKGWFLSLCAKTEDVSNPPSLGHFLEVERRASNDYRSNRSPVIFEFNELPETQPVSEPNLLFVDGRVAPPQSSPWFSSNVGGTPNRSFGHGNGCGVPVMCSCICGQPTN